MWLDYCLRSTKFECWASERVQKTVILNFVYHWIEIFAWAQAFTTSRAHQITSPCFVPQTAFCKYYSFTSVTYSDRTNQSKKKKESNQRKEHFFSSYSSFFWFSASLFGVHIETAVTIIPSRTVEKCLSLC